MPLSLRARALLALGAAAVVPPLVILGVRRAGLDAGIALAVAVIVMLPLIGWLAAFWLTPLLRLTRALEGAVLSYRDGDFSLNLAPDGPRELIELTQLHAELGLALREQRQHLAQRELLLDTVVQNTPVALVLTAPSERIAIANLAARQLLGDGRSLTGLDFTTVIAHLPEALREALAGDGDRLFAVTLPDGSEETFHHSTRTFRLQGQPHRLRLLRRMTRELSRAEVATWKRVIRVLSHELNNSLAPISSLAHSGAELARRGNTERLLQVLASIGERAAHLHVFLSGYAAFAKLPAPRRAAVDWSAFIARLATLGEFRVEGAPPDQPGWFDAAQIEQALLNLIKNAHESGSDPDEILLRLASQGDELRIEVLDRGPGMSEAVLAQALLPFYSTKRSEPGSQGGTGLGLALAREIAEAHDGHIALANRDGGGLRVTIRLPGRAVLSNGDAKTSN
ncbi:sensor histidine kinase [Roseateles sp. P5_E1]